jgi:hypothetical protein
MLSAGNYRTVLVSGALVLLLAIAACWLAGRLEPPTALPTSSATSGVIMNEPLITHMYTADPAAHVFDGQIYIYPSHDLDTRKPPATNNEGDQFDMVDYHVFSMPDVQTRPVDHGEALHIRDVPWASRQMWAPDAAYRNGTYYLYFPARDRDDRFRIGVATSASPTGPFTAQPDFIPGSFSIDPSVFVDEDGQAYMYFGGLWGGQLEKWESGVFDPHAVGPIATQPALGPRVARLKDDMLGFDGQAQGVTITDEKGAPLTAGDRARRFFEASWMHKYNGVYYLSYSTGDTHFLAYATGNDPLGPFVFRGYILPPVLGWTTHHSIVEFRGKWYLFYHDASLSGGVDYQRSIKLAELTYEADGAIRMIEP